MEAGHGSWADAWIQAWHFWSWGKSALVCPSAFCRCRLWSPRYAGVGGALSRSLWAPFPICLFEKAANVIAHVWELFLTFDLILMFSTGTAMRTTSMHAANNPLRVVMRETHEWYEGIWMPIMTPPLKTDLWLCFLKRIMFQQSGLL